MAEYSLNTLLKSIAKSSGKKRLLYNFGPLGGLNSTIITLFFFSIPFIEFAVLFNPYSFAYLGIAQSVIFYIVFASMLMILVTGLIFALNSNLVRKIKPSWDEYFPERDIDLILSSGITPYSQFFENYSLILKESLDESGVHNALLKALNEMEDENKELLDAMKRSTNL
mgnify:CR=1 FL=1